ncbi:C-type lectin domain family 7 member A-like isoform X2 [Pseudophryne corroboree]|uniref:C-type lectin domain family 7 member A-like isoform X2 n=1 Tax=Pseudophryne corroboree TaxID=495146 RepID=UPI0030821B1B
MEMRRVPAAASSDSAADGTRETGTEKNNKNMEGSGQNKQTTKDEAKPLDGSSYASSDSAADGTRETGNLSEKNNKNMEGSGQNKQTTKDEAKPLDGSSYGCPDRIPNCNVYETQGNSFLKSVPCEDDWILYRDKCYHFSEERYTWNNGQSFCLSHNASLALIDDQKELKFLNRHKCLDHHWIGLYWNNTNTGWTWTNGTLYTQQLFAIKNVSGNSDQSEYAFLDDEGVASEDGNHEKKLICTKVSDLWRDEEALLMFST